MIYKLCNLRDLPPQGTLRAVSGLGLELCLAVVEGIPHAVANRCPHAGAPLSAGTQLGGTVVCPVHGWRFRLDDGSPDRAGDPSLATFELRTLGDEVFLRVPPPAA